MFYAMDTIAVTVFVLQMNHLLSTEVHADTLLALLNPEETHPILNSMEFHRI